MAEDDVVAQCRGATQGEQVAGTRQEILLPGIGPALRERNSDLDKTGFQQLRSRWDGQIKVGLGDLEPVAGERCRGTVLRFFHGKLTNVGPHRDASVDIPCDPTGHVLSNARRGGEGGVNRSRLAISQEEVGHIGNHKIIAFQQVELFSADQARKECSAVEQRLSCPRYLHDRRTRHR